MTVSLVVENEFQIIIVCLSVKKVAFGILQHVAAKMENMQEVLLTKCTFTILFIN